MDNDQKINIAETLQAKGVTRPCPRCSTNQFDIIGKTFLPLNESPNKIAIGGPTIPSIVIACTNCGFLTYHALGPLGLMPKEKTEDK